MMQPPSFGGRVKQGSHSTVTQILGTDSNYQDVVRVYTDQGRFLSESDDLRRRRVAVLGPTVVRELELPADPVGSFIELGGDRSEEHTSELQSLMRISYAVLCLKQKKNAYHEYVRRHKHH